MEPELVEKLCWICFESSQVPLSRTASRSSRSRLQDLTGSTPTSPYSESVTPQDGEEEMLPIPEEEEEEVGEDAELGQAANSDVFIAPCQCSGDTKYVHASCLMRWIVRKQIEARQAGKAHPDVRCPQCRSIYLITMGKGIASSFPGRLLIQSIIRLRQGVAMAYPYVLLLVLSYVVEMTACLYSVHSILLLLPEDQFHHFASQKWGADAWFSLSCLPLYLTMSAFRGLEKFSALAALGLNLSTYLMMPSVSTVTKPAFYTLSFFTLEQGRRLCQVFFAKRIYNVALDYCQRRLSLRKKTRTLNASASQTALNEREDREEQAALRALEAASTMEQRQDADAAREEEDEALPADILAPPAEEAQGDVVVEMVDENGDEIFSWSSITTLVNALALPTVAYTSAKLLSYIPRFRKAVPDHFNRCLIGGCLFTVLKDATLLVWTLHQRRALDEMRIMEPRNVSKQWLRRFQDQRQRQRPRSATAA